MLLATKFYAPPQPPDQVLRPRLLAQLNSGLTRRLTLVAAPAGFGKTTLVLQWLAALNRPSAWLTLDSADNDPIRYWAHVIAALQRIWPECGPAASALLHNTPAPDIPGLLSNLINEIVAASPAAEPPAGPALLVLDDYHSITAQPVHEQMNFLIDHLPPQLHLVLTTRVDPPLALARRRSRLELNELRAADLRFTPPEVATFFQQAGLALRPNELNTLTQHTEGWVASLRLAALSLQSQPDHASFIQTFTGTDRYVVDYLLDEVLSRQDAAVQRFLLQTAILERLCAPLCAALLGNPAEHDHAAATNAAQAMLEYLEQANLFIVPLDNQRQWYRYHHLFADLLRYRLQREQAAPAIAALHHRASAWYAANEQISPALSHALAAGASEQAGNLVATHRLLPLRRGEGSTLVQWLSLLPTELAQHNPQLALAAAWGLYWQTRMDAVTQQLDRVEQLLATAPDSASNAALRGEVAVLRSGVAIWNYDIPAVLAASEQAAALLPADALFLRGLSSFNQGIAHRATNDLAAARQSFHTASQLCTAAEHPMIAHAALIALAEIHRLYGELEAAAQVYRQAIAQANAVGSALPPTMSLPHIHLGRLLYEWNDLDEAERQQRIGFEMAQRSGFERGLLDGAAALAMLLQTRGDPLQAQHLLDEAIALMRPRGAIPLLMATTLQARLWLRQGDILRASHWADTCGLDLAAPINEFLADAYLTLLRTRLAQAQRQPDSAQLAAVDQLIQRWLASVSAAGHTGRRIELLLLHALTQELQGAREQALRTLAECLPRAEAAGYLRLLTDEIEPLSQLLAAAAARGITPAYVNKIREARGHNAAAVGLATTRAAASPGQTAAPDLAEPLSEREREILQLIAAGLSNSAIAARLVIAPTTVKAHLRNIYGKLAVSSRTQAIARARELHILE